MPRIKYITPYRWVTGTHWTNGKLGLLFHDLRTGEAGRGTFDSLMGELKLAQKGSYKRNLAIDLGELRPASTQEYLEALSLGHLPSSGQGVYELTHGRIRLLLPAQLLILSLYGQTGRMRQALLSPFGPELLMRPYLNDGKLVLRTDAQGRTEPPCRRFEVPRLTWIHTYESARAGWASVFHAASRGYVDVRPPAARITAAVRGHLFGNTFAVTKIVPWSMEVQELPCEFAKDFAPKQFLLRHKAWQDSLEALQKVAPPPPVPEPRLQGLRCVWEGLREAEWRQLNAHLGTMRRLKTGKYSRRYLIEALLRKYGQPCTWPEAARTPSREAAARTYAHRLKRDECWEPLVALVSTFERRS